MKELEYRMAYRMRMDLVTKLKVSNLLSANNSFCLLHNPRMCLCIQNATTREEGFLSQIRAL